MGIEDGMGDGRSSASTDGLRVGFESMSSGAGTGRLLLDFIAETGIAVTGVSTDCFLGMVGVDIVLEDWRGLSCSNIRSSGDDMGPWSFCFESSDGEGILGFDPSIFALFLSPSNSSMRRTASES